MTEMSGLLVQSLTVCEAALITYPSRKTEQRRQLSPTRCRPQPPAISPDIAMDEAAVDLVLGPFREIVSHSNDALQNAVDARNDAMIKAAQSLAKEGERALKRIEEPCLKNYQMYGSAFVDALKDDSMCSRPVCVLDSLMLTTLQMK